MARPKSKVKKNKTITVHCTHAQYVVVKSKARECRLPMSMYLLDVGLGQQVSSKLNEQEIGFFLKLTGMANNLNQIAKRLNQDKPFTMECLHDLEKIRQLLKSFK